MKSLVIIPTFNEIENIQRMLDTVMSLEPEFNVLIVDDGSPDGTAKVVRKTKKSMTEFTCWNDQANWDWARLTSLDFIGHWNADTT